MAGNFDGLARMIVQNVGGRDNVAGLTFGNHCLIFDLKDMGRANTAVLESIGKVSSVRKQSGKYTVDVEGPIEEIFAAVCERGEIQGTDPKTGAVSGGPKKQGASSIVPFLVGAVVAFACACGLGTVLMPTASLAVRIAVAAAAAVVAFALSVAILGRGKKKPASRSGAASGEKAPKTYQSQVIQSPVKGKTVPLSEISDKAFASGILGKGIGVMPEEGKLYAPCDGRITTFFPTGHAIGIASEGGADLLIHVGIGTVSLNGGPFTPKKKQGDVCRSGDLLLEFDVDAIRKAGLDPITPVIVSNSGAFSDVMPVGTKEVGAGDVVLTLKA